MIKVSAKLNQWKLYLDPKKKTGKEMMMKMNKREGKVTP